MKTTAVLLTSALAAGAQAGIHKLAIKKVPLSEQLVRRDFQMIDESPAMN